MSGDATDAANLTATASSDDDVVLKLDKVNRTYPGSPPVHALRDVSLSIHRGEFVGVVGASGSGKSTMMNIMGTLDRPTSGEVTISGQPVSGLSDPELSGIRAHHIGFIFQQFHLIDGLNAVDNVSLGFLYRGINSQERRAKAHTALERVGLGHRSTHVPSHLSGGERQRVAIARALVGEPAVVLADEPTGNLDSETSADLMELFRSLNDDGATFILITHDPGIAAELPRRVTVLDGEIVEDTGSPLADLREAAL